MLIGVLANGISQEKTGNIPVGNTFVSPALSFDDSDTITANQTEYVIEIFAAQHYPTTQDCLIKIDSVDVPNMSIQISGSKFGESFSNIGSAVTWAGTSADTTIVISNDTKNRYRIYRATVTRNSGEAKITDTKFKLFYE